MPGSFSRVPYPVCLHLACLPWERISLPEISSCNFPSTGSPPSAFLVVQSLSHVQLFETPWTTACQASLSFTVSWSLLKLMCIESMIPSNYLILYRPLLLPSVFPSIRVFSNELALCIRWPKYWSFSFSISPSSEHSGLIPLRLIGLFPFTV